MSIVKTVEYDERTVRHHVLKTHNGKWSYMVTAHRNEPLETREEAVREGTYVMDVIKGEVGMFSMGVKVASEAHLPFDDDKGGRFQLSCQWTECFFDEVNLRKARKNKALGAYLYWTYKGTAKQTVKAVTALICEHCDITKKRATEIARYYVKDIREDYMKDRKYFGKD